MTQHNTRRLRAAMIWQIAAMLLALLAGCTTTDRTPAPMPPTQVAIASPTTAAPAPTAVPTQAPTATRAPAPTAMPTQAPTQAPTIAPGADSLLKRRETPPEGVAAEIDYPITGIAGVCLSEPNETQSIAVEYGASDDAQEIATVFFICFRGFAPDQVIEAQVTRPDGTVEQKRIEQDNPGSPLVSFYWIRRSNPGDPLGEYQVTATQGERQASGSFTVQAATTPRLMLLTEDVKPGSTLEFGLAGFTANQPVPLYVYVYSEQCSGKSPCWQYATALSPAQTNERGEAIATLATQPDDPEGGYRVVSNPPDQFRLLGNATFQIKP